MTEQEAVMLLKSKYSSKFSLAVSRYSLIVADALVFFIALTISENFIIKSSLVFYQMTANATVAGAKNTIIAIDWHYIIMLACIFYFRVTGHYTRHQTLWDELPKVFFAILISALIDFTLLSISSLATLPPEKVFELYSLTVVKWLLTIIAIILMRDFTKKLLIRLNIWQKPTVIIGTGDNARQTFIALSKEKILGFDIKLFIDIEPYDNKQYPDIADLKIPVLNMYGETYKFFKKLAWPHSIIALEEEQLKTASSIIDTLTMQPNAIDIVPPVKGIALYGLDVNHVFGREILLLRSRNNLARPFPRLFKRAFDLFATSIILIIISPLFAIFALMIKKDGGSLFFSHKRIGQNGKEFMCHKFRSMIVNAPDVLKKLLDENSEARKEWERDFKLKNDPRITTIGNFLRKTSLDELPQLFNVLTGEMSLVGPRPIVHEELERYGEYQGYYKEVKPGITGLWQISGRNDINYSYRVRLDVWYIKNWSFWYDIVILLKTIPVVLKRQGAY